MKLLILLLLILMSISMIACGQKELTPYEPIHETRKFLKGLFYGFLCTSVFWFLIYLIVRISR